MVFQANVTLTDEECQKLGLALECRVEEVLKEKAEREGKDFALAIDIPAGMRSVIAFLTRNYL